MSRRSSVARSDIKQDQAGLVSFLVVIVIMSILTLIVVAYAQITRREQRQALDRQLNSQAFFAAESGVNDAISKLQEPGAEVLRNSDYTECDGDKSFAKAADLTNSTKLSEENGISYSCLLVDATPQKLSYDNIAIGSSQVIPVNTKSGQSLSRVNLNWQNVSKSHASEKTGCPTKDAVNSASNVFKPTQTNCDHPVIRVELVPFNGSLDRASLMQNRSIFFVQPVRDDEHDAQDVEPIYRYDFATGVGDNQGKVVPAICTMESKRGLLSWCNVAFDVPSPFVGYMRVTSLYNSSSLRVTGRNGAGEPIEFVGAQVEIDVTGKAGDVLKRIRVTRSLTTSNGTPLPEYSLQSTKTQCKRFDSSGNVSSAGRNADECDPIR